MIHPSIKKCLGFDEDMRDAAFLSKWRARTRLVCKPCWELRYCPYGPIVVLPLTKAYYRQTAADTRKMLASGKLWNGQPIKKRERAQIVKGLDRPVPDDIPEDIPQIVAESACTIFGHVCPVFFAAESFSETEETRRIGRHIPFDVRMRVVRRDNHTCQACGKHLRDNEVECDHAIPIVLKRPRWSRATQMPNSRSAPTSRAAPWTGSCSADADIPLLRSAGPRGGRSRPFE